MLESLARSDGAENRADITPRRIWAIQNLMLAPETCVNDGVR
jgi:hypothetical protein